MKKLTLILTLLSVWAITNAQTDENFILSTDDVQKNELIVAPEIAETVATKLKNMSEGFYTHYDINKSQLENLQLGKPIPWYNIVNEDLQFVQINNVSRMADGKSLSLKFSNTWNVPVMSNEKPVLFGLFRFSEFGGDPSIDGGIKNVIEHFQNYEHKDFIIGSVGVAGLSFGLDYLIIRKEQKDIFVQVFDEITGEYFKNEYNFSELINHVKELELREKEKRNRYYEKVADKSELILTPEITEMLVTEAYSRHINDSDEMLSLYGIKSRAQLENLHLGKPIPAYRIVNENLRFIGNWEVPVISGSEPLFMTTVRLEDDGQYRLVGGGGGTMAKAIRIFKHKDLITGVLGVSASGRDYLIIRKENKDIFVEVYDLETREYLKNEYSLSELINLLKK